MFNQDRIDYFAPLLGHLETEIIKTDRVSRERAIPLTDSQIKSVLNKVRKTAEGRTPQLPAGSARDELLADLHAKLVHVREAFAVTEFNEAALERTSAPDRIPIPTSEWLEALKMVEESVKNRSTGAGSRAYLEFIESFLGKTIPAQPK